MTVACAAPNIELGVALRLSTFVDCQARALGENGFQALVGGPLMAGLLSGLVTIFVALIGYRLILGQPLSLRDGIGWTVRLGMVLTLITAWPAFQTLVYNVATDGPAELAGVLLPASGLPSEGLDARIQDAYDTMRLGVTQPPQQGSTEAAPPSASSPSQAGAALQAQPIAQPSPSGQLPQTASVFVMSTSGVIAALRIAVGFLLAVAPLAILALLFDATLGVFSGWVRALAGAALALLAATIVTAIDLVMVESELGNLQAYGRGMVSEAVDLQAVPTLVLLFTVAMLVVVFVAMRMAGAFALGPMTAMTQAVAGWSNRSDVITADLLRPAQPIASVRGSLAERPRAAAVADALALTAAREHYAYANMTGGEQNAGPSRPMLIAQGASREPGYANTAHSPARGRRATARRTRSAAARDRTT